jgi:hypothetical protein
VATEGMLGDLNPLGDGPGRSLADHGARVPELPVRVPVLPETSSRGVVVKKSNGFILGIMRLFLPFFFLVARRNI